MKSIIKILGIIMILAVVSLSGCIGEDVVEANDAEVVIVDDVVDEIADEPVADESDHAVEVVNPVDDGPENNASDDNGNMVAGEDGTDGAYSTAEFASSLRKIANEAQVEYDVALNESEMATTAYNDAVNASEEATAAAEDLDDVADALFVTFNESYFEYEAPDVAALTEKFNAIADGLNASELAANTSALGIAKDEADEALIDDPLNTTLAETCYIVGIAFDEAAQFETDALSAGIMEAEQEIIDATAEITAYDVATQELADARQAVEDARELADELGDELPALEDAMNSANAHAEALKAIFDARDAEAKIVEAKI